MNIIINNNKTIQVLCIYTENRHIVRNSVICVVVWYSRVVLLSVNLIFHISSSSSRSNSFEVIALDGVCTHILQFCTAAESTDWLQAISTNINALTQESVSITRLSEYVKPPEIRGLMHIRWTEVLWLLSGWNMNMQLNVCCVQTFWVLRDIQFSICSWS